MTTSDPREFAKSKEGSSIPLLLELKDKRGRTDPVFEIM